MPQTNRPTNRRVMLTPPQPTERPGSTTTPPEPQYPPESTSWVVKPRIRIFEPFSAGIAIAT